MKICKPQKREDIFDSGKIEVITQRNCYSQITNLKKVLLGKMENSEEKRGKKMHAEPLQHLKKFIYSTKRNEHTQEKKKPLYFFWLQYLFFRITQCNNLPRIVFNCLIICKIVNYKIIIAHTVSKLFLLHVPISYNNGNQCDMMLLNVCVFFLRNKPLKRKEKTFFYHIVPSL